MNERDRQLLLQLADHALAALRAEDPDATLVLEDAVRELAPPDQEWRADRIREGRGYFQEKVAVTYLIEYLKTYPLLEASRRAEARVYPALRRAWNAGIIDRAAEDRYPFLRYTQAHAQNAVTAGLSQAAFGPSVVSRAVLLAVRGSFRSYNGSAGGPSSRPPRAADSCYHHTGDHGYPEAGAASRAHGIAKGPSAMKKMKLWPTLGYVAAAGAVGWFLLSGNKEKPIAPVPPGPNPNPNPQPNPLPNPMPPPTPIDPQIDPLPPPSAGCSAPLELQQKAELLIAMGANPITRAATQPQQYYALADQFTAYNCPAQALVLRKAGDFLASENGQHPF